MLYYNARERVIGGRKCIVEQGGRDRALFFHRPEVPPGELPNDAAAHHFASSTPDMNTGNFVGIRGSNHCISSADSLTGRKPHHLPSLSSTIDPVRSNGWKRKGMKQNVDPSCSRDETSTVSSRYDAQTRDACIQTDYREQETQTNPFTPNYYVPDGLATDPEILALQGLTWGNGLPAGVEEVELIQRLRRRRDVESRLPQGNDPESIKRRMQILHVLEEEEWKDREEHVEKLQQRRLESLQNALLEREKEREKCNEARLAHIRNTLTMELRGKLEATESRRMAASRRAIDEKLSAGSTSKKTISSTAKTKVNKKDLIGSYVKYGREAEPPDTGADQLMKNKRRAADYDIRPALLGEREGVEEVDNLRGKKMEKVPAKAFEVPINYAIYQLPSLYQRREAERVINSLEYACGKIQQRKSSTQESVRRVLDLYRATPKLQRPDTPELELAGENEEEQDEACILLQRLLRGRAVQNDFFEGKERCRGLIEELQAASNAKYAERSLSAIRAREEVAKKQQEMVSAVLDAAQGDIISDTLGFLFQELFRQQDISRLAALRDEAEDVRKKREALEIARREEERAHRDREEVQYAVYARSTNLSIQCFLQDVYSTSIERAALDEAVRGEHRRQKELPPLVDPEDSLDKEHLVCNMMEGFILPTTVDLIDQRPQALEKIAPAAATLEVVDAEITRTAAVDLPSPLNRNRKSFSSEAHSSVEDAANA